MLSDRTARTCRVGPRLLACLLVLAGSGCGKQPPAATPVTSEPKKALQMPDAVPGLKEAGLEEDQAPGSSEVVIKDTFDRGEKETYKWDSKHPAGTIKGGCRIVARKGMTFPPENVIELTGENAIKDPQPKELAYYQTIEVRRRNYISRMGRAKHGYTYIPYNVVIRLRDVKVGRRRPLNRPVMMVRHGVIQPGDNSNFGGNNIQLAPLHERAQFTTWDAFPSEIVVAGQNARHPLFRQTVRYAQAAKGKDGVRSTGHLTYKPQFITTPVIRQAGTYRVSDARHPWIRGYLIVVDNPYVVVTTYHKYYPLCNFEISGVPPGRHTLEVWHPLYTPVKRTLEVEVEANKIAELMVMFHPPE